MWNYWPAIDDRPGTRTHAAADTNQVIYDASTGFEVERWRPALLDLRVDGDGPGTLQLRARSAAGVWSDVTGALYPFVAAKAFKLPQSLGGWTDGIAGWPTLGQTLGYSLTFGAGTTRATVSWVAGKTR